MSTAMADGSGFGGYSDYSEYSAHHNIDGDDVVVEWHASHYTFASLALLFQVPAVALNGVLLLVMRRDPVLRAQRTAPLLWNVTVSDLCVALSFVPLNATDVARGGWRGGFAACVWSGAASVFWCQVSVLALTLIAIERYLLIVKRVEVSGARMAQLIACTWLYSAFTSTAPLWGFGTYRVCPAGVMCTIGWADRRAGAVAGVPLLGAIILTTMLLLCQTCILLCYTAVLRHVKANVFRPQQPKPAPAPVALLIPAPTPPPVPGPARAPTPVAAFTAPPTPLPPGGSSTDRSAATPHATAVPLQRLSPLPTPASASPLAPVSAAAVTSTAPAAAATPAAASAPAAASTFSALPNAVTEPTPPPPPPPGLQHLRVPVSGDDIPLIATPHAAPATPVHALNTHTQHAPVHLHVHVHVLAPPHAQAHAVGIVSPPRGVGAGVGVSGTGSSGSGSSSPSGGGDAHEARVARKMVTLCVGFACVWAAYSVKMLAEMATGRPVPQWFDWCALLVCSTNALVNPLLLLYVNTRVAAVARAYVVAACCCCGRGRCHRWGGCDGGCDSGCQSAASTTIVVAGTGAGVGSVVGAVSSQRTPTAGGGRGGGGGVSPKVGGGAGVSPHARHSVVGAAAAVVAVRRESAVRAP